jgi:predicted nucleotidyltransferase
MTALTRRLERCVNCRSWSCCEWATGTWKAEAAAGPSDERCPERKLPGVNEPRHQFRCYPERDRKLSPRGGELANRGSGPLRLLVESRREQVMAIASRHHASRVRLFGSAARGEDRPDSDIDLLVDFDQDSSLFDLMRMSRELEALLGRPVDVVSAGGLKTRDRAILAESVEL